MELSAEQKMMVATFLRRQDELFAELPADVRVRALSTVKTRVRNELLGIGGDSVSDRQVESLLKRMKVSVRPKQDADVSGGKDSSGNGRGSIPDDGAGSDSVEDREANLKVMPREWKREVGTTPGHIGGATDGKRVGVAERSDRAVNSTASDAAVAKSVPYIKKTQGNKSWPKKNVAKVEPESSTKPEMVVAIDGEDVEDFGDRHWLGVCEQLSLNSGKPVRVIRFGFVLLGMCTVPFGLLLYVGMYFVGVWRSPDAFPQVDSRQLGSAVLKFLGIAGGMFAAVRLIEFGVAWGYMGYFGQAPDLAGWDCLEGGGVEYLVYVLTGFGPLVVMSGMPLRYRWEVTFSTMVNAGLAVYAVALSVGVATLMVGYAMGALSQFS